MANGCAHVSADLFIGFSRLLAKVGSCSLSVLPFPYCFAFVCVSPALMGLCGSLWVLIGPYASLGLAVADRVVVCVCPLFAGFPFPSFCFLSWLLASCFFASYKAGWQDLIYKLPVIVFSRFPSIFLPYFACAQYALHLIKNLFCEEL